MLMLTRKQGQSITIGDDITIVVAEVRRNGYIRLGFDAPADVIIARDDCKNTTPKNRGRDNG